MKKGFDAIPQDEWRGLLRRLLMLLNDLYGDSLTSVLVFGSVARGTATKESDVDVLVVCKDFPKSMHDRMKELTTVILKLEKTPEYLRMRYGGHICWVQFHPLRAEEALETRPIYLDMVTDSVILEDKEGFMEDVLNKLGGKLAQLGARRVFLPDGSWYWILKPGLHRGEVVEV